MSSIPTVFTINFNFILTLLILTCLLNTHEVQCNTPRKEIRRPAPDDIETYMRQNTMTSSAKRPPKVQGDLTAMQAASLVAGKNPSIVSGTRAEDNTVKHMILMLIVTTFQRFVCSGSILDSRRILTAAHCFFDIGTGEFDADRIYIIPSQLKNNIGPVYVAKSVHVINGYNRFTLQNDVAIVTITGKFMAGTFQAVTLPRPRQKTPVGSMAFAAGYGVVRDNARLANVVRQVDLKISQNNQCRRRFNPSVWPTIKRKEVICGTDSNVNTGFSKAICDGDSGGPFFYKQSQSTSLLQIGIASFTEQMCSSKGATSWFTNLKTYSNAVRQHAAGDLSRWERLYTFTL